MTAAQRVETLIIGAGIAGAAVAHELRGQDILVVDAGDVAGGASGNPKGIIRPYLSFGNSEMRRFYYAAYQYVQQVLGKFSGDFILQRGILQLPDADEKRYSQAIGKVGFDELDLEYLPPQQTSDFLKTECLSDSIYWKRAVVVDSVRWTRTLLGDAPIQANTRITKLTQQNAEWQCETSRGNIITARRVIVATGNASDLLPPEIAAQIRPRTGQISFVPHNALPVLPSALSFGHYWIPAANENDSHLIGATFDVTDRADVTFAGHQQNIIAIQNIARVLPEIKPAAEKLTPEICTGRAAVRATTVNHMTLYGRAANGIYYLTGLGSRGLMSAPYVARQLHHLMAQV